MFFIFEFFVYIIYFILKLYSIVDKYYIFSSSGSKLRKYIEKDLQNVASNLSLHNFIFFPFRKFLSKMRSQKVYRQYLIKLLIYLVIINIKILISYDFLSANFFSIQLFKKNIDIISFFGKYSLFLKVIYLFLFSFLVINFINKVYKSITKFKKYPESNIIELNPERNIYLGNNNEVVFKKEGLFQNILITGSIGSGKTSSAISNLLYQLLSSSMCGLIIDIKGTYKNILKQMIEKLNLDIEVKEISLDNEFVYNPIDRNDLSSSEIASRLKKVLELVSRNNNSDSYWLDKAKGYISDFITIIRVTNKYVDFLKLHEIIINEKILKETLLSVKNKVLNNKFSDEDLFKINNALSNLKNEFLNLDERTKNIIKSEITRITSPFVSDYNLYNKFCGKSENIDFSTELVILSIDIGKNEEIAKIIATYIKLEFQKFVLSQEGPKKEMFFVCDEYQSVANENDADFFSISREFKCINIISMQSYSSLNNTLVNQNAAKTIIQNLVNKIWFRNDDVYTVREIINQIGKETHKVKSIGYSENSYNSKYNALNKNFKDIKSGLTQSYSINEKVEYKFNEEYLTLQLKAFEAVILCSDGKSMKLFSKVKLKRWDENERSIKK